MGYRPSPLRRAHDSWFRFVAQEGHLHPDETLALETLAPWLDALEASTTIDVLALVVLEVLLEADALAAGRPLVDLAQHSHTFLTRSPELLRELDSAASRLSHSL